MKIVNVWKCFCINLFIPYMTICGVTYLKALPLIIKYYLLNYFVKKCFSNYLLHIVIAHQLLIIDIQEKMIPQWVLFVQRFQWMLDFSLLTVTRKMKAILQMNV